VKKSINHPSVIIWGFLNECASDQECVRDTIASLRSEIRQLDISRPAAFASNRPDLDISFDHSDIIAINIYPGWYDTPDTPVDGIDRVKPTLKKYAEKFADIDKPLIVSEIGAAALRGDHSGYRWSEDYQSRLLTAVLDGIFEFERYTGTALWLFCDTKSYLETGFSFTRPRGFNNKGMLDEYRRPKMAWHDVHKFLKSKGF
jgi:beta-glucuronidase